MSTERIHLQTIKSAEVLSGSTANLDVAKHFNGSNSPKFPNPEDLEFGEIALNIAKDYEVIAIKNYDGEIVYLPFNIAIRLLNAEETIENLQQYTSDKIDELSASTKSIYDDLEAFKVDINARINDEVESLSASTESGLEELRLALINQINALSAYTESSINTVQETFETLLDNHKRETDTKISSLSANMEDKIYNQIDSLSATTHSEITEQIGLLSDNINDQLTVLSGITDDERSQINTISESLQELSASTEHVSSATTQYIDEKIGEVDEEISQLDNKVNSLSGTVSTELNDIEETILTVSTGLEEAITSAITTSQNYTDEQVGSALADSKGYTDEKVSEAESALTQTIDERSAELEESIQENSFARASAYTDSQVSELSNSLNSEIESLSASTEAKIYEIEYRFDNQTLSGLTDVDIHTIDKSEGEIEILVKSGDTWVNQTIEYDSIIAITGEIANIYDIISKDELENSRTFKTLRISLGLDKYGSYLPKYSPLRGMDMSQAIDFVGDGVGNLESANEDLTQKVIDDELTTAGAVSTINTSLGFDVNAHYNSSHDDLYGMSVREAIDFIYENITDIYDYIEKDETQHLIVSITYEKLRERVNKGKLRRGIIYRITNYQASVNDAVRTKVDTRLEFVECDTLIGAGYNIECSSTKTTKKYGTARNNGFDILVMALSENTLSENAIVMVNNKNKYYNDCNPTAWQVKYCINNDTNRFDWANERGFGVIYYMKDAHDNEAPYDFKNIMICDEDGQKHFTFEDSETGVDLSCSGCAYSNKIDIAQSDCGVRTVNRVRFVGKSVIGNKVGANTKDATFFGDFEDNMISSGVSGKTVEQSLKNKMVGYTIFQI